MHTQPTQFEAPEGAKGRAYTRMIENIEALAMDPHQAYLDGYDLDDDFIDR